MNSLALTDDDVDNFIKFFHTYLKEYGMCFLNGNYIVQDNKNYLYNFLTYNTPIQGCLDKKYEKSSQVDFHWTTTHIEFFNTKDKDIKFSNCISYKNIPSPTFKKYFKVERVFKDSLSYLCDEKTLSNKREIKELQFIILLGLRIKIICTSSLKVMELILFIICLGIFRKINQKEMRHITVEELKKSIVKIV